MKTRLFTLLFAAALLAGCDPEDQGNGLKVQEENITISAFGENHKINFTAPESWTATITDDSWCKIAPVSGGAGSATVTIAPTQNETPEERHTSVIISCGDETCTVSVTQTEANALIVESNSYSIDASGGEIDVNIRHNIQYSAKLDESCSGWITMESSAPSSKALQTDVIKLKVLPNESGWEREGWLLLDIGYGDDRIKISQEGANVFSISTMSEEIHPAGGSFTVKVSGKMEYHISSMPEWLTETSEGRTHTFSAELNNTNATRTGIIVFCDDGGVCLPLEVKQDGLPEWAGVAFKHRSLFMRFTATWCGWCPRMNKTIHKAQERYPDKLEHVAIHGSGSSLYFSDSDPLMDLYRIGGFPTGMIDCRIQIDNGDISATAERIIEAAQQTETEYGTVSGAEISSTVKNGAAKVDVKLFLKAAGDYKLTVVLVEDGINKPQSDYEDGDHTSYTHDGVARLSVTPITGTAFSQDDAYTTREFSFDATLKNAWNADNMRVVAWVQTKYGDRKVIRSGNYGDFYADNCFSAPLGGKLALGE